MAKSDPSPVVRLYLASALQEIRLDERWEILAGLASHAEDAGDHNLPLMYWYAAEPLARPIRSGHSPSDCRAARRSRWCASSCCGASPASIRRRRSPRSSTVSQNRATPTSNWRFSTASARRFEGQRQVAPPAELAGGLSASHGKRQRKRPRRGDRPRRHVRRRGGDGVVPQTGRVAAMPNAAARRDALEALLAAKDPQLLPVLQALLGDAGAARRRAPGSGQYDDPQTPAKLLAIYPQLSPAEKRAALATLCARPAYGVALAEGDRRESRSRQPICPADLVRQLHNLKNDEIDKLLAEVWGTVRSTPADKAELIDRLATKICRGRLARRPIRMLGRAVFAKTCQQCHMLYGVGANIGPDLTGSNRARSRLPAVEHRRSQRGHRQGVSADGRHHGGRPRRHRHRRRRGRQVGHRSNGDRSRRRPEGRNRRARAERRLDDAGRSAQAVRRPRDAVAVRVPGRQGASADAGHEGQRQLACSTAATSPAGRAIPSLWSVENGEIVGRSPGLEHNTFLVSDLPADDFELSLEVKLVGQRRQQRRAVPQRAARRLPRGARLPGRRRPRLVGQALRRKRPRAAVGQVGRGVPQDGRVEPLRNRAEGSHVRTWINGQPCVDLDDPDGKRRGVFGLQLHSGEPMEVRFRNLQLEVLDGK